MGKLRDDPGRAHKDMLGYLRLVLKLVILGDIERLAFTPFDGPFPGGVIEVIRASPVGYGRDQPVLLVPEVFALNHAGN